MYLLMQFMVFPGKILAIFNLIFLLRIPFSSNADHPKSKMSLPVPTVMVPHGDTEI